MVHMICPMFPTRWSVNPKTQECTEVPDDCRFCSEETEVRMVRASDIHSHKLVVEQQRTPRGFLCNNAPIGSSPWISEMNWCPSRWGLRSGLDRIKEKVVKKVVKKKVKKVKSVSPHQGGTAMRTRNIKSPRKTIKVTVKKKTVVKKKPVVKKNTGQRTLFPIKGGKKK